ncbi:MAG TPA: ABC transporter substrate-binding protein [Candidatus Limnocylindrales bacterium]|nr:ABC transporter substrate-binding protein [Candidatus Limnocylindrales bacterium]
MAVWRRLLPMVAAGTLLVAACGGGASPSPSSAPPESTAPETEAPSTEPVADICTSPPKAEGTTLTLASYGGAYQEAQRKGWMEPYSALTGVTFQESEESSNATIKAQVEAGQVTWDIVDVGNDFGLDAHADLLEPLDYTKIKRDEILDGFAGTYRVADITYGVVLGYNTEETNGAVPEGWADFFDTSKFPGKRGFWDYSAGGIFEFALLADGVAPDELYPLDLDRATAKLDTIKDDIVFWASGAESQDLLGKGEVAMAMIWNGRAYSAKHIDNNPVEIQWNQQIVTADYWVVPKGTPNKDAAMDFIAWTTCAENNAAPSDYIPYGPTNKNAEPNPDKVPDLSVSNADANSAYFDDAWVVENAQLLEDTYQEWKTR